MPPPRTQHAGLERLDYLCSEIERLSRQPVIPPERFIELLLEARALCQRMIESLDEPQGVH